MSTTATAEDATPVGVATKISEGERCDACGARAVWIVYFEQSELTWCNHHYNRFLPKFEGKHTVKLTD